MSTASRLFSRPRAERVIALWFLIAAVSVWAAPSFAGGREQVPVVVTARTLVADNKARTVTYKGKVAVTRGDMTLTAEEVVIRLTEAGGRAAPAGGSPEAMFGGRMEISTIEAEGGVKVVQADKTAVSDKAVYDTKGETITMSGSPRVWQGGNVLTGARIVYNLADDTIMVEDARTVLYTDEAGMPGREGAGGTDPR